MDERTNRRVVLLLSSILDAVNVNLRAANSSYLIGRPWMAAIRMRQCRLCLQAAERVLPKLPQEDEAALFKAELEQLSSAVQGEQSRWRSERDSN